MRIDQCQQLTAAGVANKLRFKWTGTKRMQGNVLHDYPLDVDAFFFSFICCLCEKWSIYRDAMIGNRNNLCERLWVVTIWMQPLLYLSQRMSKSIVYFCYFLVVMFRCVLLYFDRAYFQGLHFLNIFAMPSYQSRLNSFFTLFCVSNNVENQSNSTQDKWVDRYQ